MKFQETGMFISVECRLSLTELPSLAVWLERSFLFFSLIVLLFHYRSQYTYLMKELFVEPVSKEDDLSRS